MSDIGPSWSSCFCKLLVFKPDLIFQGIDTECPYLQLDDNTFKGKYQDTLGTCLLFKDISEKGNGKKIIKCSLFLISFQNKPWFLRVCSTRPLKTLWGKGEIARNEQFLLFPQCFLSVWRTFCHFYQIQNCRLQTLSVWKSLKFVVWEKVIYVILLLVSEILNHFMTFVKEIEGWYITVPVPFVCSENV